MYWKYGNYRFDDHAVSFVKRMPPIRDNAGVIYQWAPEYTLTGEIRIADTGTVAGNQAAMTAKLAEFEAAFSQQYKDLVFYDDAGNPTVHKLLNQQTLGGVKLLTNIEYPTSQGAEYAISRTFQITIGAEVSANQGGGGSGVVNWFESLTFEGTGGKRSVWQTMIEGPPIRQQVAQFTTIRAVQSGNAVGNIGYIPFPAPIYGSDVEHEDRRVWKRSTPQNFGGNGGTNYPSEWAYFFEFANPAFGNPTGRPT